MRVHDTTLWYHYVSHSDNVEHVLNGYSKTKQGLSLTTHEYMLLLQKLLINNDQQHHRQQPNITGFVTLTHTKSPNHLYFQTCNLFCIIIVIIPSIL